MRGLGYRRAELYRTEPAPLPGHTRERLKAADVVTLASGSAARHLAAHASPDFDPLGMRVAAMGPQTADAAREAGFTRITLAETASLESLADATVMALQGASAP